MKRSRKAVKSTKNRPVVRYDDEDDDDTHRYLIMSRVCQADGSFRNVILLFLSW